MAHPQHAAPPAHKKKRGSAGSGDAMEIDGAAPPAKRVHVERPARAGRRDERNAVMAQAKSLWEEMRPKATDAAKTAKLATQLGDLLRGRVVEFVFRHDGSRIIQWLLADASDDQRSFVMDELLAGADASGRAITPASALENAAVSGAGIPNGEVPFFVRLACDRYGRHLALKLLRVATKGHRAAIFDSYLRGNTPSLIRNAYGADVLDFAFQTNLNATNRSHLVLELLFSREKKFLAAILSKLAGMAKKPAKITFAAALALVGDEFKDVCVESAGQVLSLLVDKDSLVRLAIVHAALDEYLDVLMSDYPPEKTRELCGLLAPSLVHLAHTKPGVSCAVKCVKILDAKHRKKVVRSLKGHIRALVDEECGHRLLVALAEWVDDTKLVGRAITTELYTASKIVADIALQHDDDDEAEAAEGKSKPSLAGRKPKPKRVMPNDMLSDNALVDGVDVEYLASLCQSKYGRMIFLSLLFPRDTRYFNPDVYGHVWESIEEDKFGKMSKKDRNSRREELWTQFSSALGTVISLKYRQLLTCHWSAPILIGAASSIDLKDAGFMAIGVVLGKIAAGEDDTVAASVCARKTAATIAKIGDAEFGARMLEVNGAGLVARLGAIDGWGATACTLLGVSGDKDSAQCVIESRAAISDACNGKFGPQLLADAASILAGSRIHR
jgi:hypothetical protein